MKKSILAVVLALTSVSAFANLPVVSADDLTPVADVTTFDCTDGQTSHKFVLMEQTDAHILVADSGEAFIATSNFSRMGTQFMGFAPTDKHGKALTGREGLTIGVNAKTGEAKMFTGDKEAVCKINNQGSM